jgi:small subunit ribosomal protein S20
MLHQLSRSGRPADSLWAITHHAGNLNPRCPQVGRHQSLQQANLDLRRKTRVANIKSQEKRIKTNERRRLRNKSVKSSLHTAVRGFRAAVESGDKDKAGELLVSTSRQLDKAASKGVIHKNQAANRKSALARAFNKI